MTHYDEPGEYHEGRVVNIRDRANPGDVTSLETALDQLDALRGIYPEEQFFVQGRLITVGPWIKTTEVRALPGGRS